MGQFGTGLAPTRKLAMLIDADNASHRLIDAITKEASKHGKVTIRRIYGDWTTPHMNSWKQVLHQYAIQPVQQYRYTVGKNATDSALIIDAMDILHSGAVDGFCIVASDSDYTKLAVRVREHGLFAMGVGERKTPKPFVTACDLFVYTENLQEPSETDVSAEVKIGAEVEMTVVTEPVPAGTETEEVAIEAEEDVEPPDPVELIKEAIDMVAKDDGWAHMAEVGDAVRKLDPGFDPRTYGYKRLLPFIQAHDDVLEVQCKEEIAPEAIYVRYIEHEE